MKKFLSLVLALAMSMSLVTVSAGAKEFKDDSKLAYNEAVAVISEIGVVDGYTDGNFNPTNVLTRGAAAKIICNLVLGPTTASALYADAASFKDVPANHEFAGYIAYCAQQGIINGYSDGTFRPAGTLTGDQFMKMLLGALGYDGEIEGFTGPNWSVAVAKLALGLGLNAGNADYVGVKAVTREEACLYAFNTLQAEMVEYDSKTEVNVGGASVVISGSKAQPVRWATGVKNNGNIKDDEFIQFGEQYFSKLSKTETANDVFGRPAAEWKFKADVIGTFTDYSTMVAEYKGVSAEKRDMYAAISSAYNDLTADKNPSDLTVYVDGNDDYADFEVSDFFVKKSSASAAETGNGVLTQVFVDDDNNVTVVVENTYLVQAASDYNKLKDQVAIETVVGDYNFGTKIEGEDFDVADVEEGDYLLVSFADGEIQSVMPATMLEGKVTQYTENTNVVIDGTKYEYAAMADDETIGTEYAIDETASVVLDQYGYIIYVDEAMTSNSYVFIDKAGFENQTFGKDVVATAYFTDGTDATISLKKVNGEKKDAAIMAELDPDDNQEVNQWFTYSKNANGEYTLRAASEKAQTNADVNASVTLVRNDKVAFLNDTYFEETLLADEETLFLVLDQDEKLTVATGLENAPEILAKGFVAAGEIEIAAVTEDGNFAKYVMIDLTGAADNDNVKMDSAAVADYMLVLTKVLNGDVTHILDKTYVEYEVLVEGKTETRMIAEDLDIVVGGMYYDVKVNDDEFIDDWSEFGDEDDQELVMIDGTITKNKNTINIDGETYYTNKNTVINLIVGEDSALLEDEGAAYEAYLGTTVGVVNSVIDGSDVIGAAYVVLVDEGTDVAAEITIFIAE